MLKKELLLNLNDRVKLIEDRFNSEIKSVPLKILNIKPSIKSWSAIECIEHLNQIGLFYVSEFERVVQLVTNVNKEESTQSTFMGRLMLSLMLPKKDNVTFKMKTFKQFKPIEINENECINGFINQLERIKRVLKEIDSIEISDVKINSAIGSYLKFNLSDALQFVIAHIERHLIQAVKAKRS